jgi:hypothetical protein
VEGARHIGSERGAEPGQLELFRANFVEQAGSGEEAQNSIERRGMRIGPAANKSGIPISTTTYMA